MYASIKKSYTFVVVATERQALSAGHYVGCTVFIVIKSFHYGQLEMMPYVCDS